MATKMKPAIKAIIDAIDAPSLSQMTGAHHYEMMSATTLRFRLPAYVANKQINRVTITQMQGGDAYTIKFTRKTKVAGVSEETLVCCKLAIGAAELRGAIGAATGLIVDKFDTTL